MLLHSSVWHKDPDHLSVGLFEENPDKGMLNVQGLFSKARYINDLGLDIVVGSLQSTRW